MTATPVELTYDSPSYDKYEDVKNKTIQERVLEWTEQLCESLAENYKQYHVRTLKGNLSGNYPEYARKQLDELENGTANLMRFRIQKGRKYYKIIQQNYDTFQDRNEYRDGSVHAFVDRNTGEVYMPASWRGPAKHVRYDMRIINERNYVHNPFNCDWAGGYLYMR
tara:strand:+ start:380 stop:877 length:498 start_codon:yes stop_codon:yes gene_type:complete